MPYAAWRAIGSVGCARSDPLDFWSSSLAVPAQARNTNREQQILRCAQDDRVRAAVLSSYHPIVLSSCPFQLRESLLQPLEQRWYKAAKRAIAHHQHHVTRLCFSDDTLYELRHVG
jgi:hypothetical protein